MLRIEIFRSAQGLETLRNSWDHLYRAGEHSIFQSPAWNLLAARVFANLAEPFVVHAENDSGAAIIPACLTGGQISFLGEALFDYRDVLSEGDPMVLRRAWEQIGCLRLPFGLTALRGENSRQRWDELGLAPAPFCAAPGVRRADQSAEDFAAAHTKAVRALRKLLRAGVTIQQHAGSEHALVRWIYGSKAAQPLPGNLFAEEPARREFMTAIAALDSRCEIFTLETAGAVAAALLTFRDDRVRRFYTMYFDPAWAHHSPGIALTFEVARRSLAEGLDCDYMTGEQPHKTRFATFSVPLYRVQAEAHDLVRVASMVPAADTRTPATPLAA